MKKYEPSFANRLSAAAKAKKAQLENARAVDPAKDPGFAERQAARQAQSVAREVWIGAFSEYRSPPRR
jgi:hypothetical protein